MSIKVHCFTNLDKYKFVSWPTELQVRPVVGEYIIGQRGQFFAPKLQIVSITHAFDGLLNLELYERALT